MENWGIILNNLQNSKEIDPKLSNVNTDIYVFTLNFVNDMTCVLGQEEDCSIKGYSLDNTRVSNVEPASKNTWLNYNSLTDNKYSSDGSYSPDGIIKIVDNGPDDLDNIIKDLGFI
jgi:hypothetical protein